ncbi:universal stress protein [Candidatus Halobonum tyrrellensis]|uniref:UspA domain-containing protein n=1 Tax=Candidatus Halobonum tyrrellensis G22 TaxID=1324957 RepID=V4HCZ9_9EURY|nr:universal stress protein [Candidatus Halobonum tyrrellensis]ESP88600.1 UspA domain-containing protein [Candidatus Halobonum tyrrellensis G22]
MYDEILVPTDGSPAAAAAIEHAVTLAERFDATIHALYVVDMTGYTTLEAGTGVVVEALEEEGEAAVDAVREAAEAADVPVTEHVVSGSPYRSILEYANDEEVDLIVMGTHGRRGLDRYLLGSVTERVVRSADQAVMTVRMPDEE